MKMSETPLIDKIRDFNPAGYDKFSASGNDAGISQRSRIYGGLYTAQSMAVAAKTIEEGCFINSLHGHFTYPGDTTKPLHYSVERIKDGLTFHCRSVRAKQDDNIVYACQISFSSLAYHEAPGFPSHQAVTMPHVPLPIDLDDGKTVLEKALDRSDIRPDQREMTEHRLKTIPTNFTVKPVDPEKYLRFKPEQPKLILWVKANDKLGDDFFNHNCVAAYISDSSLVSTSILPHQKPGFYKAIGRSPVCSLDHSIWIHRPKFRIDRWMLYEQECIISESGRGLSHGRLWTEDGNLVMTVSQETLIKLRFQNMDM